MTSRRIFTAVGVAALLSLGAPAADAHGPGFGGDGSMPYGWHHGWHMGPGMMMPGCPMGQGYGMGGPGMMGPGMMGQGMMGPGMMGPGMMGPGMMGPGYGPGGSGMPMMGPGMGQGMGPGMGQGMGPGPGMGQGMGPGMGGGMMQQPRQSVSVDDVRDMLERRLAWQGNPNVKLGKVEEKDADTILAEIVTQDGSLVERLEVDRRSGWMRMVR